MKLSRKESELLERVIGRWREEGVVDEPTAQRLEESYETITFDWHKLARYSLLVAVLCVVVAVLSLAADTELMAWFGVLFERIFNAPAYAKAATFTTVAALLVTGSDFLRRREPDSRLNAELLLVLGLIASAIALIFLYQALGSVDDHIPLLFLGGSLIYALLGFWYHSELTWLAALLALSGWFGTQTGLESGWQGYFMGMNLPLRYALFGLVLGLSGAAVARFRPSDSVHSQHLTRYTVIYGTLLFFTALWIVTIFGNYASPELWFESDPTEMLLWVTLHALASGVAIWYGLSQGDETIRVIGLLFLLLNIYTRYVEYLWDSIHKALFFAILAVSFWILGSQAEKVWQVGRDTVSDR